MTAQIKDLCTYQSVEYKLQFCLDFHSNDDLIETLSDEDFYRNYSDSPLLSTACWRNYVASWVIEDNRLYLAKLEGKYRLSKGVPIFANWFTGEIGLPHGRLLECNVETDFTPIYDQELILKFESGVLLASTLRELV